MRPIKAYILLLTMCLWSASLLANDQLQTTKFIENNQLVIIRDGKKYNAQGQTLK
ncbi:MAG: hypothetical protein J5761_05245 [Paludibacteraceae bacterium]|nr:hypothetical protein [Paludibacteraceae bacterium]